MKRMLITCNRQLKTLKGSPIKRSSKYGVGKEIGGQVYFHLQYISDIVPQTEIDLATVILQEYGHDISDYNVGVYDPKTKVLRFVECPEFDDCSEPTVGAYISINLNSKEVKEGYSNTIYHHKWLFVRDDYTGFDVDGSYEWSKYWLSRLPEKADGTNKERWINQLKKYNIV